MSPSKPAPHNVPGDFYIASDCCITCGVMHDEAPDMLSWGETSCYVARQPQTPEDLDAMVEAMAVSEVECLYYRGTDEAFKRRLVLAGLGRHIDGPPPAGVAPALRSLVVFGADGFGVPRDVTTAFERYFAERRLTSQVRISTGRGLAWGDRSSVSFDWIRPRRFHFTVSTRPHRTWLGHLTGSAELAAMRSAARLVHGWLGADTRISDVGWRSSQDLGADSAGAPRPY